MSDAEWRRGRVGLKLHETMAKDGGSPKRSRRRIVTSGSNATPARADEARPQQTQPNEAASPPATSTDVMLVHSPTEDGKGARVLRLREESIEAGEVRPLEDGKPITGEVVKLKPRDEAGRVCDVEVLVPRASSGQRPTSKGPAQVASPDYRDNWSRIFAADLDPKRTLN